MTTKRDPWVQVKSDNELRAGMTVEVRPCSWCKKVVRHVLLRSDGIGFGVFTNDVWTKSIRFTAMPILCVGDGSIGFPHAIREGRLFRLADDQLSDLSETRELESVR